jgi:hypothetical protein
VADPLLVGSLSLVREESPLPETPTPIPTSARAPTPPCLAMLPNPPLPTSPVHQGGELVIAPNTSQGHLPQTLGKYPCLTSSHVTDDADRISLTQDELQAIIQQALAGATKATPPEVNAPGRITFEGGLHLDKWAAKCCCHQPKAGHMHCQIDLGGSHCSHEDYTCPRAGHALMPTCQPQQISLPDNLCNWRGVPSL